MALMARRKTNGTGTNPVGELKKVRLDIGKLRHDTKVRFLATERVIAGGFAELVDRIDQNGLQLSQLVQSSRENNELSRENTALLRQMVEQGKTASNLEPRISRCELDIEELKKKT